MFDHLHLLIISLLLIAIGEAFLMATWEGKKRIKRYKAKRGIKHATTKLPSKRERH